jgi:hypothetical protein
MALPPVDEKTELEARQDPRLLRALDTVAPGTPLREGIDNIVHARTGGLILVGEAEEVSFMFSGANLLLRGQQVAALIDFRPPGHRSPVWELGRIVLDPRTVLAAPDWPTGMVGAIAAYRAADPALPAGELLAVPRVYPFSKTLFLGFDLIFNPVRPEELG